MEVVTTTHTQSKFLLLSFLYTSIYLSSKRMCASVSPALSLSLSLSLSPFNASIYLYLLMSVSLSPSLLLSSAHHMFPHLSIYPLFMYLTQSLFLFSGPYLTQSLLLSSGHHTSHHIFISPSFSLPQLPHHISSLQSSSSSSFKTSKAKTT